MTDAAIHRVLGRAERLAVRLLRASGSPRAFRPRDDKRDCADRLLFHSGSPQAVSPRDDKILYAGATLAGMALLGCRPFGLGPPRSAWLSASAVILPSLAHCFWKPTRKPTWL